MAWTLNVLFNYSFLDIYAFPYVFLAGLRKRSSPSSITEKVSDFRPNFVDSSI